MSYKDYPQVAGHRTSIADVDGSMYHRGGTHTLAVSQWQPDLIWIESGYNGMGSSMMIHNALRQSLIKALLVGNEQLVGSESP